jgi:hypothetical protein
MATKSRRTAQKHWVYANLNVPHLTKAGSSLELYVFADGVKIGEMDLGRGGVTWKGGGRQKKKRFSWTRFAEMMNEQVYGPE